LLARWFCSGLLVAAFGVGLALISSRFGYAYDVAEMPVAWLAAALVSAGVTYALFLPRLVLSSLTGDAQATRSITVLIVGAGLAARLALFASEPILEDDYQRYLWDGAVTAHGHNPYAISPKDAVDAGDHDALGRLARSAATLIGRINHADLRTVYPPVAQGAFALAHLLKPWSLFAWRTVLLVSDLATLALILLLLRECGRSPLWSALYWWHPVVIKELFNSAHMDAIVLPLALAALWFVAKRRYLGAVTALAFAAGAKVWPALLLPLVVRPLLPDWRKLLPALIVFAGMMALWATPILLAGFDAHSGFAAYLSSWQTNSAHFPALESGICAALDLAGWANAAPGVFARVAIAILLGGFALAVSVKPIRGSADLVGRASILVACLVLLTPAQYPWYSVWFAPFLAFKPWQGFLVLAATIPLYYTFFHFSAREQPEIFNEIVVWIIWVPVWVTLALEAMRRRMSSQLG
jgi:alpha-1,6-mannosyltransferase